MTLKAELDLIWTKKAVFARTNQTKMSCVDTDSVKKSRKSHPFKGIAKGYATVNFIYVRPLFRVINLLTIS